MKPALVPLARAATCVVCLCLLACGARTDLASETAAGGSTGSGASPTTVGGGAGGSCDRDMRTVGDGEWARSLGVAGPGITGNGATSLAVDGQGRLVASGLLDQDLGLDCLELPLVGDTDLLLAAFEPDGRVAWARRFGAPNQTILRTFIGLDSAGDVFLIGQADEETPIDLGLGPVDGTLFIASYDRDGQPRSTRGFALPSANFGLQQAAVSPEGDLTFVGSLVGDVTIDGVSLHGGTGETVAAVVGSFDANGVLRFAHASIDGPFYRGLACAPDGRLALSRVEGGFNRWTSGIDLFDANGTSMTTIETGSAGVGALAFVGDELVVARQTGDDVGLGWLEGYALRSGELLWHDSLVNWNGGEGKWPPYASVVVGDGDRILSALPLLGTADFGQGPVPSHGGFDAMLVSNDLAGHLIDARQIGGAADEDFRGLVPASPGHVAVIVQSTHDVDLGFGAVGAGCDGPCDQLTLGVVRF